MERYSNEKLNMDRLQALDRALMASRLVQPEFYQRTEAAILGKGGKGPDRKQFFDVCKAAQITDMDLVEHMWEILYAARKVYMGQSPIILW